MERKLGAERSGQLNMGYDENEWTLNDESLKAGVLDPKKWPSVRVNQYKINILHTELFPIYKKFVYEVTGQRVYPPSDTQRLEFERMVLSVLCLNDRTKEEKIALLLWDVENIHRNPYWEDVSGNLGWSRWFEPIKDPWVKSAD